MNCVSESTAAANFMRSVSRMSSDSEHEDTEFERKLSVRASRRLSAKRRGSSALQRTQSGKAEVHSMVFVFPSSVTLSHVHSRVVQSDVPGFSKIDLSHSLYLVIITTGKPSTWILKFFGNFFVAT